MAEVSVALSVTVVQQRRTNDAALHSASCA